MELHPKLRDGRFISGHQVAADEPLERIGNFELMHCAERDLTCMPQHGFG
jgi:hypothetical protein